MALDLTGEALYVGAVVGIANKHGLNLRPVVDDDGNYEMRSLPDVLGLAPPPDDWKFEDWLAS